MSSTISDLLLQNEFITRFSSLCLHTVRPPWCSEPPSALAPGGAIQRKALTMLKHTMLFYSLERLDILGKDIVEAIKAAMPKGRTLLGAVARPNYYCSCPKPLCMIDGTTAMVMCGNTVPLSPLLQMVVDDKSTSKEWVCESCRKTSPAPGGDPLRCLLLDPVVKAHGRQGQQEKRVPWLQGHRRIELIVASEPEPWASNRMPAHVTKLMPKVTSSKSWTRAIYSEHDSADVWTMAARWSSQ